MRESVTVKFLIVGFLMMVLLIPLAMILGLVSERTSRRDDAVREVSATWANPQVAGAIVLTVPYTVTWTDANNKTVTVDRHARFLPEALTIDTRITPTFRHRGLFDVPVYTAHLVMRGIYRRPDLAALHVEDAAVLWDRATLGIGIGDLRGVTPGLAVTWNNKPLIVAPAVQSIGLSEQAMEATLPKLSEAAATADLPFTIELDLRGTSQIRFQPSGKTTTVTVASPWPDPKFFGAFLPETPNISAAGFEATWRLSHFGRGYPQSWLDTDMSADKLRDTSEAARFGVALVTPVDIYQQSDRSVKYGALFILLTFLTFFLTELFQRARLHPVQYLLVGAALCLFYLLLLSLSEQVGFGPAYIAASGATIGVIAMYAGYALGGLWQGARTALGLVAMYGFLYILLRLEDYALLAGTLGLFAILAGLMYVTRRVNWYEIGRSQLPAPAPAPASAPVSPQTSR
jgi:inner membrane protein